MPTTKYANVPQTDKTARAFLQEGRTSRKQAYEICNLIRGKPVQKAKFILMRVLDMKQAVPMRRHNGGVAHRKGQLGGWDAGRYPQKATNAILSLIEEAEANAAYKGLDTDRLIIRHINSYGGRHKRWNRGSIVFGRRTRHRERAANIEIVLEER
ncbi:MAG: 50S ribosomal protein L22 [Methanopyri archaeon]|jgi:large subunit ribosomal protein L22|nr:50S ribosomal protein L22 [Methanopyri archaeon]